MSARGRIIGYIFSCLLVWRLETFAQPLTVTTFAGQATIPGNADGPAGTARFHNPEGLATDTGGNVYVADSYNQLIRKITPSGMVSTIAGPMGPPGVPFGYPGGVVCDLNGNVYVADNWNDVIEKITPNGEVTILAGLAGEAGYVDLPRSLARFYHPQGIAIDRNGYLYVADRDNSLIRKISPDGDVTTLAGCWVFSSACDALPRGADGTGSTARFRFPEAVATDADGNVYVADTGNFTIRKITPAGVVTTFAGQVGMCGSVDGIGTVAEFCYPGGIATDSRGNVYVADTISRDIRKITPDGVVTTMAGLAGYSGSADGAGSLARFNMPQGVTTGGSDVIYIADTFNHTIRKAEFTPSVADIPVLSNWSVLAMAVSLLAATLTSLTINGTTRT